MRLLALSDLHLDRPVNWDQLQHLMPHPDDWLILAGDIAPTIDLFGRALDLLTERFAQLLWVPGNHELWTDPTVDHQHRGEERYRAFVDACRQRAVITPEDPYTVWPGSESACRLVPLFLLYDYSFSPSDRTTPDDVIAWAKDEGVVCADEYYLDPTPYPSRAAWCAARCDTTEARLREIPANESTILINHFPLREEHALLPRIPRFKAWCGTQRTEDWHHRFRAKTVVYGHLHIRKTQFRDGVRFEEVSLGYPQQWNQDLEIDSYLRQILPSPWERE